MDGVVDTAIVGSWELCCFLGCDYQGECCTHYQPGMVILEGLHVAACNSEQETEVAQS